MVIADDRIDACESSLLLTQAWAGDAEAFCEVARAHETRLFRQAVVLCRDEAVAEDLVAETLLEAWRSLQRFDATCRFSTWLYAILVHRYLKWVRRMASRPVSLARLPVAEAQRRQQVQEALPDLRDSPADVVANQDAAEVMRDAIARLPRKHQRVLLLRFFEDASLPEIAAALGCPVGTVKSRLHHALEKLRRMKLNLSELRGDT
jgi:RNA polymerase sigma-70 factor (ECF subfamily)